MNEMKDYYEKYYDTHKDASYLGETYEWSSRFKLFGEVLKNNLGATSKKVLDIGCGDATFAKLYPEYNWHGIDLNLDRAAGKPIKAKVHDLSVVPYPYAQGEFDAIVCSEVLEHLWDPRVVHKQAHRMVKKDGVYIISTPNFNWLANIVERGQRVLFNPDQPWTMEHIRHYTPDTHTRDLAECGFKVINIYGADHHFCPIFSSVLFEIADNLKTRHNLVIDRGTLDSYVKYSAHAFSHTVIIEAKKV